MLEILGSYLKAEGYRVTELSRLASIEELIDLKANCFIIDEYLPHVTGHIICILLKSKPQTKHIPVILMSALTEIDYYADLSEADAFINKPYNIDDVVDLVKKKVSLN